MQNRTPEDERKEKELKDKIMGFFTKSLPVTRDDFDILCSEFVREFGTNRFLDMKDSDGMTVLGHLAKNMNQKEDALLLFNILALKDYKSFSGDPNDFGVINPFEKNNPESQSAYQIALANNNHVFLDTVQEVFEKNKNNKMYPLYQNMYSELQKQPKIAKPVRIQANVDNEEIIEKPRVVNVKPDNDKIDAANKLAALQSLNNDGLNVIKASFKKDDIENNNKLIAALNELKGLEYLKLAKVSVTKEENRTRTEKPIDADEIQNAINFIERINDPNKRIEPQKPGYEDQVLSDINAKYTLDALTTHIIKIENNAKAPDTLPSSPLATAQYTQPSEAKSETRNEAPIILRLKDRKNPGNVINKTEMDLELRDIKYLISRGKTGSPSDADIIGRYFDRNKNSEQLKMTDREGNTILHLLAQKANEAGKPGNENKCYGEYALTIRDLIATYGADPKAVNGEGNTPIKIADNNEDVLRQMDDGLKDYQLKVDKKIITKEFSDTDKTELKNKVLEWRTTLDNALKNAGVEISTPKETKVLLLKTTSDYHSINAWESIINNVKNEMRSKNVNEAFIYNKDFRDDAKPGLWYVRKEGDQYITLEMDNNKHDRDTVKKLLKKEKILGKENGLGVKKIKEMNRRELGNSILTSASDALSKQPIKKNFASTESQEPQQAKPTATHEAEAKAKANANAEEEEKAEAEAKAKAAKEEVEAKAKAEAAAKAAAEKAETKAQAEAAAKDAAEKSEVETKAQAEAAAKAAAEKSEAEKKSQAEATAKAETETKAKAKAKEAELKTEVKAKPEIKPTPKVKPQPNPKPKPKPITDVKPKTNTEEKAKVEAREKEKAEAISLNNKIDGMLKLCDIYEQKNIFKVGSHESISIRRELDKLKIDINNPNNLKAVHEKVMEKQEELKQIAIKNNQINDQITHHAKYLNAMIDHMETYYSSKSDSNKKNLIVETLREARSLLSNEEMSVSDRTQKALHMLIDLKNDPRISKLEIIENTFKKDVKEIERNAENAGIIRHKGNIIHEPDYDKSHPNLNHSNKISKPKELNDENNRDETKLPTYK